MDAQELRNLQEAYSQVYQVDEAIRNPESRKKLRDIEDREVRKGDKSKGENPRSKYSNEKGKLAGHLLRGPESTGSKGNPVRSRGGTNAPADERVGRGPHRAGNAAYWAGNAGPNRDRGAGNKAARRAGKSVPNTRDMDENYDLYDIILSHLLDEGYAETPEAAEAIMVNMSEEWRESICEELTGERKKRALEKGTPLANRVARAKEGQPRERTGPPYLGATKKAPIKRGGIGDKGRGKSEWTGYESDRGSGNKASRRAGKEVRDTSDEL